MGALTAAWAQRPLARGGSFGATAPHSFCTRICTRMDPRNFRGWHDALTEENKDGRLLHSHADRHGSNGVF